MASCNSVELLNVSVVVGRVLDVPSLILFNISFCTLVAVNTGKTVIFNAFVGLSTVN